MFASMFGPSEDGFADNLTIPEGIEIAEPEPDATDAMSIDAPKGSDEFQDTIRRFLAVAGNGVTIFTPNMPSFTQSINGSLQDVPRLY